ncbi:hypothetical protein AB1K56_03305 [Microbacterium sp. BWR-S6Y]|uniref:hypothetical protein n=1 Tax=Microbacterium sp. BWR-S6Y TaxID=3232073 RepID=UPI00352980BC
MTMHGLSETVIRAAYAVEADRVIDAVAQATGMTVAEWRSSGLIIATPLVDVQPDGVGGVNVTVVEVRIEHLLERLDAQRLANILGMKVAVDTGYSVRLIRP